MTFLSGADMWSRVSQRQICADVCHLKWSPQCVSLTGKHDMKMIKQPRVYVKLGPAMGATGATDGLMGLNFVVERVCVRPAWISWRSKVELGLYRMSF